MEQIQIFLDFDGTITTTDVVDEILERFADPRWKEVEKEWVEGKIGSKECLSRQVECLKMTPEELKSALSGIAVDPGFVSFLRTAERLGVPVTIVSDGFDLMIEEILKKTLRNIPHLLKAIPIYSNELKQEGAGWKAKFPYEVLCHHGCANCKPVILRKISSRSDFVVFVGDGLSDRFAAKKANLTFAKGALLPICVENDYPHHKFEDFFEIEKWLENTCAERAGKKPSVLKRWLKGFPWVFPKKSS